MIADVHLGKVTHFRKAGIAVPREKMEEDLVRLDRLVRETNPQQVFFLGDLFHSDYNAEIRSLENFIDTHPGISFSLVTGNHDLPGFLRKIETRIQVEERVVIDGFSLQHHPEPEIEGLFQVCGHIHPAVKMRNRSKQVLKLPCFHITGHMMMLPSFGSFTGSEIIRPKKMDRVFVVAGEEVMEVNSR
jgi:DNA ligase-associated metallophosphoesterase